MNIWIIRYNPNVKVITEQNYLGLQMKCVENKGRKIALGDKFLEEEYLFTTFEDAMHAVDRIHEDIVKVYGGVKLKNKA